MSLLLFILNALASLGFVVAFFITGDFALAVIAYSFFAVLPVSIASMFDNPRDIFSPLNLMTYLMIMSSPLFAVYIYFIADLQRSEMKMYGLQFDELVPGISLLLLGMLCLLTGYLVAAFVFGGRKEMRVVMARHGRVRLRTIAILAIGISLVAGFFFARDIGFSSILADGGGISAKRIHEDTVGIAPRGSALTHWRLLGTSLPHALILVYATLAWSGRIKAGRADFLLIVILLITSAFIPFIASARTPIFEILLLLIMIRHYLVKQVSFPKMIAVALAGLFAVGILGELRQSPGTERSAGFARYFGVFEEVLAASYFMDLSKSAIIVKRVPEEVEYIGGWSLVAIFTAAVPRQIWPEKPVVRVGYFVGQEVIDLRNQTGIPPGFIAELYLNAGYMLVPIPMILLGFLMRLLYQGVRPGRKTPGSAIAYVMGINLISLALLPADFTYAAFLVLTNGLLVAVLYFSTKVGSYKPMPRFAPINAQGRY